jgi:hypothetical protein
MDNAKPTVEPAATPSEPAPAQVADSTPASDGSPSFDVKAFEARLKKFGPDWTLDNWESKLAETRKTLGKQGRELAEFKQKYERLAPFDAAMQNEHGFREAVGEAVREFYAQRQPESFQPAGYGYQPTPAPLAPYDPVVQRLDSVETQLRTERIQKELSELQSKGYPLDEDMADSVTSAVLNSKWGSARDHYMALYGEQVIAWKAEQAAKAAAEAIQKNNATYSPAPTRTAGPPTAAPDLSKMSKDEYDAYARNRWAEVLGKV